VRIIDAAIRISSLCLLAGTCDAQNGFTTIPAFPLDRNPLVIHRSAIPNKPFSVTGERGAILGQQDGTFELWLLPVKMLHHAHLTAKLKDYDAVIDLNAHASSIEVRPDHTTITYTHAAITVRQHMFIPRASDSGLANAVILFEIHASRPAELTLSFAPTMEQQWPAPNFGRPGSSWLPSGSGGAYLLETDNPAFYGMIAMPNAQHGPIPPYQERPETVPLEFHLSYDPQKDDHSFYPLLCGLAKKNETGSVGHTALLNRLLEENTHVTESYNKLAQYYDHFFDSRLTASTPDHAFDEALRWAEISIEESKVAAANGSGLAGGWYTSGDSARPGFGWFFGRDTLWTLYAINSYGDFALSGQALDFLLAHQRDDGKMMHEYSQTAAQVDWVHMPYLYASADSTPLFVMQMEDYVRASGDLNYLKQHWDNVKRAYAFTRSHTTEGVYDNTQGTGWVEEWAKLPHQEIYLASLDQQSSDSFSRLAILMGEKDSARQALATSAMIKEKLIAYRAANGSYRFSRNEDGSYEDVLSIFPAVAWWSGYLTLPKADETFRAWASHEFSTDWGVRSVATSASIYDPISYHHGSVWPLYAGWASMAQYRTGRPLQAYANLRNTVELTWLQDLGAVTEVVSGEFLTPLGRSSSHQLWSSAMILAPAVRGLFGLEADALNHTLHVTPQLPATWDHASVEHVSVGDQLVNLQMQREGARLIVTANSLTPSIICLTAAVESLEKPCAERSGLQHRLVLPLPPVEIGLQEAFPEEGDRTSQMKVLNVNAEAHRITVELEAPAGSAHRLYVRRNGESANALKVLDAEFKKNEIIVNFVPATNAGESPYLRKTIRLQW
jgi:glycogen debranching enzyme